MRLVISGALCDARNGLNWAVVEIQASIDGGWEFDEIFGAAVGTWSSKSTSRISAFPESETEQRNT
jgi:hypothetical protein